MALAIAGRGGPRCPPCLRTPRRVRPAYYRAACGRRTTEARRAPCSLRPGRDQQRPIGEGFGQPQALACVAHGWSPIFRDRLLVGTRGFEPPTPASRTLCSTRLSHVPTFYQFIQKTGPGQEKIGHILAAPAPSRCPGGKAWRPKITGFSFQRSASARVLTWPPLTA